MPFRFVHTADLHLDSPLRSLALRNPDLAELIGTATRAALEAIVDLCLDERVDALLIAGDLYDGDQTSMATARLLAEQVERLDQAGIRVFAIRGNHDALARITKELVLPPSVKVYGARADAVAIGTDDLPVVIHGLSFKDAQAPRSLLPDYRPPVADAVNIGLMHTSLNGAPGHDPYAPCSVADLEASGFTYWALGHIHKRQVHGRHGHIVMAGMPQGRFIDEAGPKSVTLVTVADDHGLTLEERPVALARFERLTVDLGGIEVWDEAVHAAGAAVAAVRETVSTDHLVLRPRLEGATPLAWRLRRDLDRLQGDAEHRAAGIGGTWIEKIELACSAPGATDAPVAGPVEELRRLMESDVAGSDAFEATMRAAAADLFRALPPRLRSVLGDDEAEMEARLRQLARDGVDDVLALVAASADADEG